VWQATCCVIFHSYCSLNSIPSLQLAHNAEKLMGFAKAMLHSSRTVLMPHNKEVVQLRIGIHSGPLVSGLVGTKMPKFTL
jgi:class 3 adenylate cyclase